jgi:transcriptional regulator GlxA family with amidase domain
MPDTTRRRFLTSSTLAAMTASINPTAVFAAAEQPAPAPTPAPKPDALVVGMVVFEGFELLDVFGPLEMFGMLRDKVAITLLAENPGPVRSGAGPVVMADRALSDAGRLDVLLIPGGGGTRREVNNPALVALLKSLGESTPHVASICTGSAVLARTGLLDGRKATTNKRAYAWATGQGPLVGWVAEARWVEDGKFFTSSGVSAGMDMALGLIAQLFDHETAVRIAQGAEYAWHEDKTWDPFAKLNGL